MTAKIVGRGYVVVYNLHLAPSVTAVVSGPRAKELQRRVSGKIVNAAGHRYRVVQRDLRVIIDNAPLIAAARA